MERTDVFPSVLRVVHASVASPYYDFVCTIGFSFIKWDYNFTAVTNFKCDNDCVLITVNMGNSK